MKIYNVLGHANQFCVETDTAKERKSDFVSYNSHCVSIDRNKKIIVFWKDWNYSKTTRKHLYAFFNDLGLYNLCDKKSVLQAIQTWIYNTPYTQYKVAENYDL